jgi:hypothetical protein
MSSIRESDVESYLVEEVKRCDGVAEKFSSPQRAFVPDRIVTWPSRAFNRTTRIQFVECKAPGKEPNAGQLRDHARRRAMGSEVFVVDTFEAVDKYIKENRE